MKKNKIFVIALLSYSVIALSACIKREIKNVDSKGKHIICFGDSLTFGYGAGPGEDYPTVLTKLLNAPVINSGIDGDTTIEALKRFTPDVLEREPYLVIIEFCGNDFLRKIPLEVTLKNIREMVTKSQQRGALVAIVDVSAGMFLREYRAAFLRLAREEKAIFIPQILSGIITNPSMKSDFLHPNAKGYQLIAQRVYRKIFPYLKNHFK